VRADVLLQHAGLLAADAAFLADVLPSAAAADVHVVLVGLVPGAEERTEDERGAFILKNSQHVTQMCSKLNCQNCVTGTLENLECRYRLI